MPWLRPGPAGGVLRFRPETPPLPKSESRRHSGDSQRFIGGLVRLGTSPCKDSNGGGAAGVG